MMRSLSLGERKRVANSRARASSMVDSGCAPPGGVSTCLWSLGAGRWSHWSAFRGLLRVVLLVLCLLAVPVAASSPAPEGDDGTVAQSVWPRCMRTPLGQYKYLNPAGNSISAEFSHKMIVECSDSTQFQYCTVD